jgi:hypothetical protein
MFYTRDALVSDAEKIAFFAEKEGLSGHARSAVSSRNNMKAGENNE